MWIWSRRYKGYIQTCSVDKSIQKLYVKDHHSLLEFIVNSLTAEIIALYKLYVFVYLWCRYSIDAESRDKGSHLLIKHLLSTYMCPIIEFQKYSRVKKPIYFTFHWLSILCFWSCFVTHALHEPQLYYMEHPSEASPFVPVLFPVVVMPVARWSSSSL